MNYISYDNFRANKSVDALTPVLKKYLNPNKKYKYTINKLNKTSYDYDIPYNIIGNNQEINNPLYKINEDFKHNSILKFRRSVNSLKKHQKMTKLNIINNIFNLKTYTIIKLNKEIEFTFKKNESYYFKLINDHKVTNKKYVIVNISMVIRFFST